MILPAMALLYEKSQDFNISSTTKLSDLKRETCIFWGVKPEEFELYEGDHILLMRYDENVEKYFFSTIEQQRGKIELRLKMPMRESRNAPGGAGEGEDKKKKDKEKKAAEQNLPEKKKRKIERRRKMNEIEKSYPGLQYYKFDSKTLRPIDMGVDNHVLTFLCLLILLTFNIIMLTSKRNITYSFTMDQSFEDKLTSPPPGDLAFNGVTTVDKFYSFFNSTFAQTLMDSTKFFLSSNVICGPIRVRQLRVVTKPCIVHSFGNTICYEKLYSSTTKGKMDISISHRHF